MSFEDVLAGERTGRVRHEWVAGFAYAMAGGTERHDTMVEALRDIRSRSDEVAAGEQLGLDGARHVPEPSDGCITQIMQQSHGGPAGALPSPTS